MPPTTDDPGYARLLLLVGGIASDVKNVLIRQDGQDTRITRIESRLHAEHALLSDRVRTLEAFKWKLVGVVIGLPVIVGAVALVMKEIT